jgi:hypothetical protein
MCVFGVWWCGELTKDVLPFFLFLAIAPIVDVLRCIYCPQSCRDEQPIAPELEVAWEKAEVGSRWKVVHPDGGKLRELAALLSPEVQTLNTGTEVRVLERELVTFGTTNKSYTVTCVRVKSYKRGGATGWLTCTLPSGKKVIERLETV